MYAHFQVLSIDILHPLCELTSKWHDCQNDPVLDPDAHPVFMNDSVYTQGTSDGKKTPLKYSMSSGSWSRLPSPTGVEIEDYAITTYRGRLIWIGGRIFKSKYERELSRNIFVMKDGNWREESNFVHPLPESITSINRISASSDGKYLIIAASNKNNRGKFLIFDGCKWIETCGPCKDSECTVGDIIVHNGVVYLIELKDNNCRMCHMTSLKSLLAVNSLGWKFLYVFDQHSNLTVAGGHVVTITYDLQHTLYILGFSTVSDSWIELEKIECTIEMSVYGNVLPNIVGVDDGKVLLMGRIKVNQSMPGNYLQAFSTLDLPGSAQFYVLELTPKGMHYY